MKSYVGRHRKVDTDDTEELYIFAQGERYHESDRKDQGQVGLQNKGEEMNIFNIKTKEDFIAFLYAVVPAITVMLAAYGVISDNDAALWAGVATSIIPLGLQLARTQVFARKAIYTILGAANTVLMAYCAAYNPETLDHLMPVLAIVLGAVPGGVASQNVNTTGDEARNAA